MLDCELVDWAGGGGKASRTLMNPSHALLCCEGIFSLSSEMDPIMFCCASFHRNFSRVSKVNSNCIMIITMVIEPPFYLVV